MRARAHGFGYPLRPPVVCSRTSIAAIVCLPAAVPCLRGPPVPDSLRDQLQTTLGASYTLERELGGGGMSRVFLADEHALGRQVVVKLLAPELAAGISAERFTREIRLAASLQQANIVPLLSAGTMDALPYYTMPFVDGESVRHRLARGPLSIVEAVSTLRDVARALAYAHARGVVHRDIKPDNVLLSGGTAVVTDFGIAKALNVARAATETSAGTIGALTGLGTAIGTPAYMAPEQAAGDPDADHRVDIYAFGCLAYELLAGAPPFSGLTPQKLLAAQMSERPRPIEQLRPEVPPALAAIVAQCLEKDPDARPGSVSQLLTALDGVSTTGSAEAMPGSLHGGPGMFRKAIVLYVVSFIVVAVLARAAVTGIGLPDWVFPGALIAMALGLPAVLLTGYAQRVTRQAVTMTPTYTPGGSPATNHGTMAQLAMRANPHLSWRRTARWGGYAMTVFALLVAGAMTLRALGIGPFGTLFAAGTMRADDRIVVADFASPSDSSLGQTIAQGVKADLAQSSAVQVLSDGTVANTLGLMRRSDARLTLAVAREVAQRAGARMVVDGSVAPLGTGFLVTLRLVTADSARELASYRESVDSPGALIGAVGVMTRKLRGRIGESLRDVQQSPRLAEVTTTSLEALRKYSEGRRALLREGDRPKFFRLLNEAIALDSSFATAYMSMAMEMNNRGGRQAEASRLIARAFVLRDRLPLSEQHGVEAAYYMFGPRDVRDSAKVIAAELAGAADPADRGRSLNNVAVNYAWTGRYTQADSMYRLAIARDSVNSYPLSNLAHLYRVTGQAARAESVTAELQRRFPSPRATAYAAQFVAARGATDSALAVLRHAAADRSDVFVQERLSWEEAMITAAAGRLRDFEQAKTQERTARQTRGIVSAALDEVLARASAYAMVAGDRVRAQRVLDSASVATSIEKLAPEDRPYVAAASAYAYAGRLAEAKRYLQGVEGQITEKDIIRGPELRIARANVAIAEHRWDDAIREARLARFTTCSGCVHLPLALAYDGRGDRDSAIAAFERTIADATPAIEKGIVLRRLGELYESTGNAVRAMDRYRKFVALWARADPELQPQVNDVRARLARLQAQEARGR